MNRHEPSVTTSAASPRGQAIAPAKGERKPTPPNPIFDALVEACGLDYADMTDRERRACGVAAAELGHLEAPPDRDEVLRRARLYPEVYPDATCTPNAIARHWAQLGAGRPRRESAPGRLLRLADEVRRRAEGGTDAT